MTILLRFHKILPSFFAKKLFETGNFIYAEPNFCFYSRTDGYSQNTYFDSQWAINNDSVSVNVLDAWSITTGSNKIKTAVIDAGVDLSHEDLDANLVEGYNACSYHQFPWNIGNGSYEWVAENHGTMCAGIISAENNNIGIVGIAHTSKIIPIRAGYVIYLDTKSVNRDEYPFGCDIITDLDFIDALDYANSIGKTDVICFPLTLGVHSSAINDMVSYVCNSGRKGKGVIFVVTSGNTFFLPISFQETNDNLEHHPDVISVGAITVQGQRAYGSRYGNSLNMVAPGENIMTTDINNQYCNMLGTSSAAPHVAGVAALVLSVNPCLTREEVTYILESTCTKVRPDLYSYGNNANHPNGTWNIEVGHGLVNAYQAVLLAQQMGGYVFRGQDTITTNTLWDTVSLVNADLVIDSLATLTITDTLHIADSSSIIVRPGGKLIVNGGTLTSACDGEMWEGFFSRQYATCQHFHYLCTRERDEEIKRLKD